MVSLFASSTRQLGRFLRGAPLVAVLVLGHAAAHAQVVPTPAPAAQPTPKNVAYYVDGQPATPDALSKLDPSTISDIQLIKGANQQRLFSNLPPATEGVAVVTTKANAGSPAVLAFNKRIHDVVPLTPATPAQASAVAAVQAYLAKTYPAAKLQMVGPVTGKTDRYQAIFEEGGKRLQLLFDGQGQPVQQ